jgi:hypothetical protein
VCAMSLETEDLLRDLSQNAESVCRHYLPAGRREGSYWMVGDLQNNPGRSLFVRLTGPTSGPGAAGKFTDSATGNTAISSTSSANGRGSPAFPIFWPRPGASWPSAAGSPGCQFPAQPKIPLGYASSSGALVCGLPRALYAIRTAAEQRRMCALRAAFGGFSGRSLPAHPAVGGASPPCPLEPPLMRSVAGPDRRPFRDSIIGDAFLA